MALRITERHGPIAPWLGGRGQNPVDPDSVDAGIRLVHVASSKIEDCFARARCPLWCSRTSGSRFQ